MSLKVLPTLLFLLLSSASQPAEPILLFTDLTSGPRTGNSDTSKGKPAGQDGVIVTVWGRYLGASQGSSKVLVNGAEALVYTWGNATAPADLYSRLGLQMVSFQIPHSARDGTGSIALEVDGKKTNELPFTVRPGRIFFIQTTGDDTAAGDWSHPWKTITHAVKSLAAGDTAYVGDGVNQTQEVQHGSAVILGPPGEPGKPKALVVYPGARSLIGTEDLNRGFRSRVSGQQGSTYWTVAKFTVTARTSCLNMETGNRVVGNFVTCPKGSAPEGAIQGSGNDLFVLGNEITHVGKPGCTKLYHPIYISSPRTNRGPRLPAEANREIAWNYIHDNNANRGVNIYSEQSSTAYLSGHKVHDNFIINQVGDGILIGQYVTGENWIYNNVVANCGLGPNPDPKESVAVSHWGVNIDAGHESISGTVIHFYNNTIYGCGWNEAAAGYTGAVHMVHLNRYQLRFENNIIVSTGEPYISGQSNRVGSSVQSSHNLWFGKGAPPSWDVSALNVDPKFVDAAKLDFRLQPDSPAVGAGVATKVPGDLERKESFKDGKRDLGAEGHK